MFAYVRILELINISVVTCCRYIIYYVCKDKVSGRKEEQGNVSLALALLSLTG